jgi:two-component system alkaline phosphatase synthesis response regulator PhoP
MKPLIFIIEDDASLQELYTYSLEGDFDCHCFADGEAFFGALAAKTPDLILLDIMLPGDDGFAILARLKSAKHTSAIPVIMVSAKDEEVSKVKGLNMGADDYVSKPFSVLELAARVKANLRKSAKSHRREPRNTAYKDIVIDPSKHQITVGGTQIQATRKEYKLLLLFCENAETVQEREVIFAKIWGSDFVGETRTLDIHVKELRRKLSEAQSAASIQTIRGVGYMLV